jgi:hypothetical protein
VDVKESSYFLIGTVHNSLIMNLHTVQHPPLKKEAPSQFISAIRYPFFKNWTFGGKSKGRMTANEF